MARWQAVVETATLSGLLLELHENAAERRRVHKADPRPLRPGPADRVQEWDPGAGRPTQRLIDILDQEADMVQPLTPPLEEPSHRARFTQRGDELDAGGPGQVEKRHLGILPLHRLAIRYPTTQELAVAIDRGVQVADRYGHVVYRSDPYSAISELVLHVRMPRSSQIDASSSLEITSRWISEVPSPMVHSLASRKSFSTG